VKPWPHRRLSSVPAAAVAEDLAARVRLAIGQDSESLLSCDLRAACQLGEFFPKAVRFNTTDTHQALLVPRSGGAFEIFVDPTRGSAMTTATLRHRTRFRIAHEIGHSFFYDRDGSFPTRVTSPSLREEEFCDLFASALLVPRAVAASLPLCAQSVQALRDGFDVSTQVAGRALAHAHPTALVAGLLWNSNPRTGKDPGWRVAWAAGSRFLPEHVRLRSDVIEQASLEGTATGLGEVIFGRSSGRFQIAARKQGQQMVVTLAPT
jgi:hypothetical protein